MNRKGFVSSYFLILFLYMISISSVIVLNDQDRIRAMMNLEESNEWFGQEAAVITDLKCRLRTDRLEEDVTLTCADGTEYRLECSGDRIYVSVLSEHPEEIELEADIEKRYLIRCSIDRESGENPE